MSGQATLANSFLYEHCDVPPGVSLKDWRPARVKSQRPSRRRRAVAAPSALTAIMRRGGAVQSP
jgi:hypothetical protein